jgi:hypothetical protein
MGEEEVNEELRPEIRANLCGCGNVPAAGETSNWTVPENRNILLKL